MLIKSGQVDWVDMKKGKPGHFVRSRFEDADDSGNGKGNGNGNGNGNGLRLSEAASVKLDYEKKLQAAGQEAYARGLADGIRKGADAESAKVQSALKSLVAALAEFEKTKRQFISSSEKELLDLVLAAAECVIHREASVNRETVSSVLNAAMKKILDRDGLRIRLNPEDYRYMTENHPGTVNPEWLKKSTLVEDETISRGGVVIETLFGEVDARLETQFQELRQALAMKEV
jgi:flagellar assembly protein FliH